MLIPFKGACRRALLLLVCIAVLTACATHSAAVQDSLPLPDPMGDALGKPEYLVGPGDLLEVKVFQVDDLERTVRVDGSGRITLPLIGTVDAAGKSLYDLQALVTRKYGAGYLQDPQVSILIQEFTSQRVTVGGAVEQPGVFPMPTGHMTLQQAVATAKGVSTLASRRNVVVFRMVKGQRMLARFDLVAIEKGELADPDVYAGDIVVVYRSEARVFLRTIVELTPLIAVWRVYNR